MQFRSVRRFGWSDAVGPLWFLRERWSAGPRWRPAWARFFAGQKGIACQVHTKAGGYATSGFWLERSVWEDLSYAQKEDLIMGWIKAVRRPDDGSGSGGAAVDPLWVSEFPALHEYLSLGTNADGTPRRTATLTLFTEHGSWKCFLNERDAGASLCASGDTVSGALSALEVMLEAENTPWRFSEREKPDPARRSRKSS